MPLTKKGKEILAHMRTEYGGDKGKKVFYASKNKGTIKGVEGHQGTETFKKKHGLVEKMTKMGGQHMTYLGKK